jgi:formylglycine-generating enzyme required for sulfatase activity
MGSPAAEDGRFGNEHQHAVEITKAFYLGKFEVTRGDFAAFVKASKDKADGGDSWAHVTGQTDQHPVVNVSWRDAVAFCEWLSRKEGKTYRLPTEAEWEYSCRAGARTRFHNGDDDNAVTQVANFNSKGTVPVGQFQANAFGLHDMHGNVWEWCQDWHDANYYRNSDRRDPQGPDAGALRVIRGGSWSNGPRYCRSAYRDGGTPSGRFGYIGFRVLCVQ